MVYGECPMCHEHTYLTHEGECSDCGEKVNLINKEN